MTAQQHSILFAGNSHKQFALSIAQQLGISLGNIQIETFADKETHIVVQEEVRDRDVYIVQSTYTPANEYSMELLLIAHAVASQHPKSITAVMPFFGYRRQERASSPGEGIGLQLIPRLLHAAGIQRVITMDLHTPHSKHFFEQAGIECLELSSFTVLLEYIQQRKLPIDVVCSPDQGGVASAQHFADALGMGSGLPFASFQKKRQSNGKITIHLQHGEVQNKNILIVDDEINTGSTLLAAIDVLKAEGAQNISVAATHGVFSDSAIDRLQKSELNTLIITDTIPPAITGNDSFPQLSVVPVASVFAESIHILQAI